MMLLAAIAIVHAAPDGASSDGASEVEWLEPRPRDWPDVNGAVGLFAGLRPAGTGDSIYFEGRTPASLALGLELELRASPLFAVAAEGGFTPLLTRSRSRHVYCSGYCGDLGPRESTVSEGRAAGLLVFSPFQATVVRPALTYVALDLGFGFGAIRTVDDLEALQAEMDAVAQATAVQWHPTLAWLVGPRFRVAESWSMTLRARGTHWIEVLEGIRLERESFVDFGAGVRREF